MNKCISYWKLTSTAITANSVINYNLFICKMLLCCLIIVRGMFVCFFYFSVATAQIKAQKHDKS